MQTQARTFTRSAIATAIICLSIAAASMSAPRQASAVTVGIGDNGPRMFADRTYQQLGSKISRKIIPYDFYRYESDRADLRLWLAGAKSQNVAPLIAFNHSARSPRRLPSVSQFKYALRYLRREHPEVKTFSPWNEANHHTQPTARNPKRAAQYYNAARQICRGCRLVAADVLDQKNMIPWLKTFRRYAKNPSLWGLHSYSDTNRNIPWSNSGTKRLLDYVNGAVWLTEVGGLVAFGHNYRYSESRAKNATRRTLALAKKSRRIQRIYLYSWYGTDHASMRRPYLWDSGLMSPGGHPRPAFYLVRDWFQQNR